jgi:hypothetical protein
MAQQILSVVSVDGPDDWTAVSDKVTDVNSPDDDGTTFINPLAWGLSQGYVFDDPRSPINDDTQINFVRLRTRLFNPGRTHAPAAVNVRLTLRNGDSVSATNTHDTNPQEWQDFTNDYIRTPSGNPWTKEDLTGLKVVLTNPDFSADHYSLPQVTTVELIVNFEVDAPSVGRNVTTITINATIHAVVEVVTDDAALVS